MIEFIQAHLVDLGLILALLVRLEMAVAKLTKNTTDDAIGEKLSEALKKVGIDTSTPK